MLTYSEVLMAEACQQARFVLVGIREQLMLLLLWEPFETFLYEYFSDAVNSEQETARSLFVERLEYDQKLTPAGHWVSHTHLLHGSFLNVCVKRESKYEY